MKRRPLTGALSTTALLLSMFLSGIEAAQAVPFQPPPGDGAPRSTTGGASRGNFFTPPSDNAAPRSSTGGASRGNFFTPPSDNAAPRSTTGGASRGEFFVPPSGNGAPRSTTGGASRGDFFAPPTGSGAPRRTTGGASRGDDALGIVNDASASNDSSRGNAYGVTYSEAGLEVPTMLAVMPDSFFGTTVEARPTILVYIPRANVERAVFSLKDEERNTIYERSFAMPSAGGVVAIEMPEEAPELTVGENYQWYVAVQREEALSPSSPFVDGWVRRIEPSRELASSLELSGSNPDDAIAQIEALGANGVWYDTASRLAALAKVSDDETIAAHWQELLESVGLAEIAAAPIAI